MHVYKTVLEESVAKVRLLCDRNSLNCDYIIKLHLLHVPEQRLELARVYG